VTNRDGGFGVNRDAALDAGRAVTRLTGDADPIYNSWHAPDEYESVVPIVAGRRVAMTVRMRRMWSVGLCLVATVPARGAPPDEADLRVLQVCEGILRLFERSPSAVWPGYNLATRPLVVYRANRWALRLGDAAGDESFGPYPSDWPPLNHPSRLDLGPRKELSGQLVFDYPVGDSKAVAIGVPDPEDAARVPGVERLGYEASVFGYIVHEAFHQYQDQAFGEIPWGQEERYPILDLQNSALAGLEM